MKNYEEGFTLLELLIVIIIVGVLATLGLTQYASVVEKSRGEEARQVISQLRRLCFGRYIEVSNISVCDAFNLSIGAGDDLIPGDTCRASHFFRYGVAVSGTDTVVITATRCLSSDGGKNPPAATARALVLTANMINGNTTWSQTGAGGY